MQRFIKTLLSTGIPFGLFIGLFYLLFIPSFSRYFIMAGIGSGLVFGLCMAALVSFNSIKQTVAPLFENSEQVIKAGPANHFQRNISMGGWLYLTNARLVFRSHSFLQKTYELSIPTSNITQAQPCMTMWIIPNGLRITINEGNFEQFVVEQQHAWVATIRERNLSLTPNSV